MSVLSRQRENSVTNMVSHRFTVQMRRAPQPQVISLHFLQAVCLLMSAGEDRAERAAGTRGGGQGVPPQEVLQTRGTQILHQVSVNTFVRLWLPVDNRCMTLQEALTPA